MTSSLEGEGRGGRPKDDMWWHDDTQGRNGAQKCGMITRNLEHNFFSPVIDNYCFKVSYIKYSALQCHLAAAFCFIIKIYFIVSKTLLLPMSKDMNMKITKTTTQLCSRFGAYPQYCAAWAEMVFVQQCHRNRKTESSSIKWYII